MSIIITGARIIGPLVGLWAIGKIARKSTERNVSLAAHVTNIRMDLEAAREMNAKLSRQLDQALAENEALASSSAEIDEAHAARDELLMHLEEAAKREANLKEQIALLRELPHKQAS